MGWIVGESQQAKTARQLLQSAALRPSPVRVAVLGRLLQMGRPVSHNDLWKRKKVRSFNRVTVYRTLRALKRRAIVHSVQGTDGVWRYCAHAVASGGCPGDHPHFVCSRCRRMICLLGQTMPFVEVPPGTSVEAKQFVVYGTCPDCQKELHGRRKGRSAAPPQSSRQR
jgi:Fur family ferric uptake transcriptional regulator